MNDHSDIDRVLDHWFEDGPSTMPDRVVDVVARRISLRPQRRSRRLLWRFPMRPAFTYGAAAAAAIALAILGYNLLPKAPATGAPLPSATSRIPSPSRAPVVVDASAFGVPLTLTLPSGWKEDGVDRGHVDLQYGFEVDLGIHPLALVTLPGPTEADPWISATDFVTWIKSRPEYLAGEPKSVTFGGRAGTEIDADYVWKPGGTGRPIIKYATGSWIYDQKGGSHRVRFIILPGTAGSGGVMVVMDSPYPQFDAAAAALDQLLTTLQFTGS